ncbi:MAG: glycosyltransferase [Candidatus Hodarchaeota archaeon]
MRERFILISVVCVYNNSRLLKQWLLKDLKSQTVDYELILIDNTKNMFKSAAEALNHGGRKVNGNYIMFAHQDVNLCSNTWLEEVENILNSISNLGIAGVVGMSNEGEIEKIFKDNIKWGYRFSEPVPVQTLDECLVIIPHSIFKKLQFDEVVCDNWHLYAVDYCLSIKSQFPLKAYLIPLPTRHIGSGRRAERFIDILRSFGDLPQGYYKTLEKMRGKHKTHYRKIYTTCGVWNTQYHTMWQRAWNLMKAVAPYLLRNCLGKNRDIKD